MKKKLSSHIPAKGRKKEGVGFGGRKQKKIFDGSVEMLTTHPGVGRIGTGAKRGAMRFREAR